MTIRTKTRFTSVRRHPAQRRRRGVALVVLAISLLMLVAFISLAIDLGMLALAQTQISDAADAAAMAGARALNGDTTNNNNNNYSGVTPAAQAVVAANKVLGSALSNSSVSLRIGRYTYNTATLRFEGQYPGPSTDNWSMVEATVTSSLASQMAFASIVNFSVPNLKSVATAAHRPRDICMILDYSGSMRFGSLVGLDISNPRTNSNNLDTVYPTFGHYSSASAGLQGPTPSSPYLPANITTTTSDGRPPIVLDFYSDNAGTVAFSAAPSSYGTTPGGDCPLKTSKNTGAGFAQTTAQIFPSNPTKDTTFESSGYNAYTMITGTFAGYTQGPGYYGKTFFIWPPNPKDPNNASRVVDWRKLYFTYPSSATPMDDNSRLWDTTGKLKTPGSSTYNINYTNILTFIKAAPSPFPSQLQSGRIVYYNSIPATIDTTTYPPSDLNQRFWKDYIDYVLGFQGTGVGAYSDISTYTGYGLGGQGGSNADFQWGTVAINSKPTGTGAAYMNYADNPLRPRLRFWFGPLTLIDFLGNYNLWTGNNARYCWWPGTCHEFPLYACKLGIQAALNDINKNHPNDWVSLIMFSHPQSSASDNTGGRFNRVRVGLGRNYSNMQDSLWYPPSTVGNSSATVTPYDSANLEVPRAMGGTSYSMALMLAYNQFSNNSTLVNYGTPAGDAGGNGRQGAQKVIIFETDGQPTFTSTANFVNNGAYQSYYAVRYNSANPGGSEYPTSVTNYGSATSQVTTQIYSLCTQLAAQDSAGGFSTASRPLLIHCLAFGPQGTAGLPVLTQMQTIGNVNDGMPSYKIINGDQNTIITNLQTAIAKILQDGVQVSLIQ